MSSRHSRRQLLGLAGAAALAPLGMPGRANVSPVAGFAYDLVDIVEAQPNPFSSNRFLIPNDINEAGDVLGNSQASAFQDLPYVFADGALRWLDVGEYGGRAIAFINRDVIAGRLFTGWTDAGLAVGHPVIWDEGGWTRLPVPDGLSAEVINASVATAHPDGRVGGSLLLADGTRIPMLWQSGEPIVLPMLNGFPRCEPKSILDNGRIGGTASDALGFDFPICWDEGTVYLLIATGNGFVHSSVAPGANALFGSMYTGARHEATVWRRDGFEVLPRLPGDFYESWVEGMNAHGMACGTVARASRRDAWTAVLWQQGHIRELASLVELDAGTRLLRATAINDAGQIAAAAIWSDGTLHAVLLNPR